MLVSPNRLLYGPLWCLLALPPCRSAAQLTFPATVEVDLIFPRNDTYAPTAHMPIVFAIQNSRYAAPLDLHFSYTIFRYNGFAGGLEAYDWDAVDFRQMVLKHADFSSSDPYFVLDSVPYMNSTTEGSTWKFLWTLSASNCSYGVITDPSAISEAAIGGGIIASGKLYFPDPIEFTTKNGAPSPDLVAATADDTCASSGNFTFSVTGTLEVPLPQLYDGRNSCAILPTPYSVPPANPCGAKLNSSAASSISSAVSSCAVHHPTVTSGCIPLTTSDGHHVSSGRVVFLMAVCVWLLVYFKL
jgi:hypothetical protein